MKLVNDAVSFLKRNPDVINRLLMVIVVIAILALAIFLSGNKTNPNEVGNLNPSPTPVSTQTVSDIVESNSAEDDLFADFASTSGVVVASSGVVILLIGGILIEIISNKKR